MTNNKLLIAAGMVVCLAACSEKPINETPSSITISPVITRVTDLNFENGDCIGLTITNSDGVYADNAMMTFGNGLFSSDAIKWYQDMSKTSRLIAYYPYNPTGMPTEFSVAQDQSGNNGYAESDLLASVKPDVTPSEAAVNMTFKHLLSKLNILVSNKSNSAVTAITITGSAITSDIDIENYTVTAKTASVSEITANTVVVDSKYQAIIIPQTAILTFSVKTADGRVRTISSSSQKLLSGSSYTVSLDVDPINISISIKGEISGWNDGGEIQIGNNNNNDPDNAQIEYQGDSYSTMTLSDGTIWMAENMRYVPTGHKVSDNPSDKSGIWYPCTIDLIPSNDAEFIKQQGLLYDLQTAAGTDIGSANYNMIEGVQGICPEGWHIPTRSDLENLAAYCNASEENMSSLRKTGIIVINGIYKGIGSNNNFTKGYLIGSTPAETSGSTYNYLSFENTANILQYSPNSGIPLRCVKNTKNTVQSL